MFRKWRQRFWQRRVDAAMPSRPAVLAITRRFPALAGIQLDALRQRAAEILACKAFIGAGDFQPSDDDRLVVALLAARPILKLGISAYADFHTFILYPGAFIAETEYEDETGVISHGRDLRAGEAWAGGPVVLSLSDVRDSAQGDGFDVVVHELAHQIDQLSGDMDGCPPLHRGMDPDDWTRTFSEAFERLSRLLDAGQAPAIDPYAAESPAEYFAVSSEYVFDAPDRLRQHEPEVFRLLQTFYAGG